MQIRKAVTGAPAGYDPGYTIGYDCDDGTEHDGSVLVAASGSVSVPGIPTGTRCTVSEPTLPTAPSGYTFGTPTFAPSATVTIPSGNGSSVSVTATNTLIREGGTLTIAKTLSNPDGAPVPRAYSINYNCGIGSTGTLAVAAGASVSVSGIPTGSTCTVSEVAPAAVPGYSWGTITYAPASVVIANMTSTFKLTVANSISASPFYANGSFVIGDKNAGVNTNVTFWGAQWWKDNSLSGGSPPAAFKGFADYVSPAPLTCGSSWTTRPGNSSSPPNGPLPALIAVIVSNKVTQTGSTISGTVSAIVVVRTGPGYDPNPGHAGTGKVVAVLCTA